MRKRKSVKRAVKHAKNPDTVVLDPGPLCTSLGFALRMASVAASQRFHQVMRSFHLRPAQFSTMVLIAANPGVRQRDICETLRIEKANFVGLLDILERRKLVERRADSNDRRRYALYLTKGGQALLRKAVRAHNKMEADLQKLLPARARKDFLANLVRLESAIRSE
jgi:DNA-binding MarR family transcriptional regulator